MNCPETGHSCFDLDCQTMGCQGDGIRRLMKMALPRTLPKQADYTHVKYNTTTITDPAANEVVDKMLEKSMRRAA